MTAAGAFVAIWEEYNNGSDIYAQRFFATGTPMGGEFPVNLYTADDHANRLEFLEPLG